MERKKGAHSGRNQARQSTSLKGCRAWTRLRQTAEKSEKEQSPETRKGRRGPAPECHGHREDLGHGTLQGEQGKAKVRTTQEQGRSCWISRLLGAWEQRISPLGKWARQEHSGMGYLGPGGRNPAWQGSWQSLAHFAFLLPASSPAPAMGGAFHHEVRRKLEKGGDIAFHKLREPSFSSF